MNKQQKLLVTNRVLTDAQLMQTANSIADLQCKSGMIPWFENGHCDPWNHIETAMALDVMGLHKNAYRAYQWLKNTQRNDGAWSNYYNFDETIKDFKLDSNVCAYVGTGLWHHWLCNHEVRTLQEFWPMLEAAMNWVLQMRLPNGTILWAREENNKPWDYALLTGCSSIRHALICAANVAEILRTPRPEWNETATKVDFAIRTMPQVFEPKERWAMDWYYPVLSGSLTGSDAKSRLEEQFETFVMNDHGVRCVSDEPWITASETAECSMAFSAIGDIDTAQFLLNTTLRHRNKDGSYLTGLVYPDKVVFPADEATAYTGAAIILAADSLYSISPASQIFRYNAIAEI